MNPLAQAYLRTRLPDRRPTIGEKFKINGRRFFIHFNFDEAGAVRAVHFSTRDESADLTQLLTQTCSLLSKMLQGGWRLSQLSGLRTEPFLTAILAAGVKIESEFGTEMAALVKLRPAADAAWLAQAREDHRSEGAI